MILLLYNRDASPEIITASVPESVLNMLDQAFQITEIVVKVLQVEYPESILFFGGNGVIPGVGFWIEQHGEFVPIIPGSDD
jgi:hypothetical protein